MQRGSRIGLIASALFLSAAAIAYRETVITRTKAAPPASVLPLRESATGAKLPALTQVASGPKTNFQWADPGSLKSARESDKENDEDDETKGDLRSVRRRGSDEVGRRQ